MAAKFPFDVTRHEVIGVLIDNIVVDWAKNMRWGKPRPEVIQDLANNLYDVGQEQPISIIKNKSGNWEVRHGFCRAEAFKILNRRERAEGKSEEELTRCKAVVVRGEEDLDSIISNISENEKRAALSPMDRAYGMSILMQKGKTQQEVAEFYGFKSQGSVSNYLSLLKLDKDTQNAIHAGQISYAAALELLKVPEKDRKSIMDAAKGEKKDQARTPPAKDEGASSPAPVRTAAIREARAILPGSKFSRNVSKFRELLANLESDKAEVEAEDDVLKVLNHVMRWFEGDYTNVTLIEKCNKVVSG